LSEGWDLWNNEGETDDENGINEHDELALSRAERGLFGMRVFLTS